MRHRPDIGLAFLSFLGLQTFRPPPDRGEGRVDIPLVEGACHLARSGSHQHGGQTRAQTFERPL